MREQKVLKNPQGLFFEPTRAADLDAPRKKLPGKEADVPPLLKDCLVGSVRLRRQTRLVHLPIQPLEALDTSHVFRFRYDHVSRNWLPETCVVYGACGNMARELAECP